MNYIFLSMTLLILETLVMFARCHGDGCSIQQHNVSTQSRHVCQSVDVILVSSDEFSEELDHFSNDLTLGHRLRRLYRRSQYMKRRIQILKEEYLAARHLNDLFNNLSLSHQSCTGLIDIGSRQSLSIHRKSELTAHLEYEYVKLTKVVGILTLMQEDEEQNEFETSFTQRISTARSGAETVICELFYTIRKVYSDFPFVRRALPNSHVTDDGWYTPVVTSWCPTTTGSCRHERNGIVLTQLVRFASVLRNNIRTVVPY